MHWGDLSATFEWPDEEDADGVAIGAVSTSGRNSMSVINNTMAVRASSSGSAAVTIITAEEASLPATIYTTVTSSDVTLPAPGVPGTVDLVAGALATIDIGPYTGTGMLVLGLGEDCCRSDVDGDHDVDVDDMLQLIGDWGLCN